MTSILDKYDTSKQMQYLRDKGKEYGKEPAKRGNFSRGLSAGVDQTQAIAYGAMAAGADIVGFDNLAEQGIEGYQRNMDEASENAPDVASVRDIDSVGSFGDWAAYTLGNSIPTLATVIGTGGVTGAAGQVLARKAATELLTKQIAAQSAKLVASGVSKKKAGQQAASMVTAASIKAGGIAGFTVPSVALSTGEIVGSIEDATGQIEGGTALAFGLLAGTLDTVPLLNAAKVAGMASSKVREGILSKVKDTGWEALKQAGSEGATEMAQSVIEQAAVDWVDGNLDIFSEEMLDKMIDAGASGALMGFAMGTGSGAAKQFQNDAADANAALAGLDKATVEPLALEAPKKGMELSQQLLERQSREGDYIQKPDADRPLGNDSRFIIDGELDVKSLETSADKRKDEIREAAKTQIKQGDQLAVARARTAIADIDRQVNEFKQRADEIRTDNAAEKSLPALSNNSEDDVQGQLLAGNNKPWKTEKAAGRALQQRKLSGAYQVESTKGGFALKLIADKANAESKATKQQKNVKAQPKAKSDVASIAKPADAEPKKPEAKATELNVTDIDVAANESATSDLNDLPKPTQAQKEAGNYKLGKIKLHGLDVSIENPKGSIREGQSESGKKWKSEMKSHYGYVKGSEAIDGDHVDLFINSDDAENADLPVYVVDQINPKTGAYDEAKVMVGFASEDAARAGYQENYDKNWKGLGAITPMSIDQFKKWVKSDSAKKPVALKSENSKIKREASDSAQKATLEPSPDNNKNSVNSAINGKGAVISNNKTTSSPEQISARSVIGETKSANTLYHRTSANFDKFDESKYQGGDVAGIYFSDNNSTPTYTGKNTDRLIKAKVRIKNPATRSDRDAAEKLLGKGWTPVQLRDELVRKGFDGYVDTEVLPEVVAFKSSQIEIVDDGRSSAKAESSPDQKATFQTNETRVDGDNIEMFSRTSSKKTSGIGRKRVDRIVRPFNNKWKNGPKIKVVDSISDIEGIGDNFAQDDQIKGVYRNQEKTVYIVADAMESDLDVARTLLHEVQHFANREKYGKQAIDKMAALGKILNDMGGVKKYVENNGVDYDFDWYDQQFKDAGYPESVRLAKHVDELLAVMASDKATGMGRLRMAARSALGAIRRWLRSLGLDLAASLPNDQLVKMLNETQKVLIEGSDPDVRPIRSRATNAHRVWHGSESTRNEPQNIAQSDASLLVSESASIGDNTSISSNPSLNDTSRSSQRTRNAFNPNTTFIQGDGVVNREVGRRVSSSNTDSAIGSEAVRDVTETIGDDLNTLGASESNAQGLVQPSPDKDLTNIERRDIQSLADSLVSESGQSQLFSNLDIERRTDVLRVVGRLLKNLEIRQGVMRLVPVDVMNVLAGEQLSANALLNDVSVLVDLPSINSNDSVASRIGAVDHFVITSALVSAEIQTGSSVRPNVLPRNLDSTLSANGHKKILNVAGDIHSTINKGSFKQEDMYSRPAKKPTEFGVPPETLTEVIIRKFQDKHRVLRQVQENIKSAGGKIEEHADAYQAEELFHGKAENDIRLMREAYIEPLAKLLSKYKIKQAQLDQYLYAMHAKERNDHIASINDDMPDGGSGMTNAEADKIIAEVTASGKLSEYDDLSQIVYDMLQSQRDTIKENGLEDEGLIGAWEDQYKNYVPLRGFADNEQQDDMPGTGKGFSIGGKESKRAAGRKSKAASPSSFAINQLTESIVRKRKNEVGNAFLELVKANPDKNYWQIFTDDNPDIDRRIVKGAGGVESVQDRPIPMAMMSNQYFQTKKNGKVHYIKIEDPRLLKSMNNIGPEQTGIVIRALSAYTRFLSTMNTSLSPEFMVSNFSRDVQTAALNLSAEQSRDDGKVLGENLVKKVMTDIPSAMKGIHKALRGKDGGEWGEWFEEFSAEGAKTGYFDMKDIDGQMKDVERLVSMADGGWKGNSRKAFKTVADAIENANASVENAVRLSTYKNAVEAGISKQQAASLAKGLTVNFNRRGEIGTTLNALYMFANASIQGTANFARTMVGLNGDGKIRWRNMNNAQKLGIGIVAGSASLAMANRFGAGEDDDGENYYDKIPAYIKERNFVFMKSLFGGAADGTYFTIPLPYGYNVLAVLGNQIESVMFGGKNPAEAAGRTIMATVGSFSPIGFSDSETVSGLLLKNLTPTVASTALDVGLNENFFGGSVYNENFPFGAQKPNSSLGRRSTPEWVRDMSMWMNKATGGSEFRSGAIDIHPDVATYVAEEQLGSALAFAIKAVDFVKNVATGTETETRRVPFLSKVYGRVTPYKDRNTFYDRRNQLGQLKAESKALTGSERREFMAEFSGQLSMADDMKAAEKQLRALRKRRDLIYSQDLGRKEKTQRLKLMETRMKSVVDSFNKSWNKATDQ